MSHGATAALLLLLGVLQLCTSGYPPLPTLTWTPRSDWLNVKTLGAKGDGKTDDTAAIVSALGALNDSSSHSMNHTVYFPPGVYLLSKTATIGPRQGGNVIGHGATSILKWNGPASNDTAMVLSAGTPRFHFIGLTWDGNHKAGVGLDHASKRLFGTFIHHEHEIFTGFLKAGVQCGVPPTNGGKQTAEVLYTNVQFTDSYK